MDMTTCNLAPFGTLTLAQTDQVWLSCRLKCLKAQGRPKYQCKIVGFFPLKQLLAVLDTTSRWLTAAYMMEREIEIESMQQHISVQLWLILDPT